MEKEKVKCSDCDKLFRDRFNMWRHYMRKHFSNQSKADKRKSEKPKPTCSLCGQVFYKNGNLKRHSKYCKKKKASTSEDFYFNSVIEFEDWKRLIEMETNSRFVRKSNYKLQNGSSRTKYCCHRSGYFKPQGKNVRRMKLLGSNKINAICPAKIIAIVSPSGKVEVSYFSKHISHSMELQRLTLSKRERAEIAEQIAKKIPFKEILSSIRNSSSDPKMRRLQLLTKKDLHNIEKEFKVHIGGCDPYEDMEGFLEAASATAVEGNQHQAGPSNVEESVVRLSVEGNTCVEAPFVSSPDLSQVKDELRRDFELLLASVHTPEQALNARKWIYSFHSFVHSTELPIHLVIPNESST